MDVSYLEKSWAMFYFCIAGCFVFVVVVVAWGWGFLFALLLFVLLLYFCLFVLLLYCLFVFLLFPGGVGLSFFFREIKQLCSCATNVAELAFIG